MGIKTAILKKKLEKTATSGELFVADQLQRLYDVMEQLVKATHDESTAEIKALTKQLGTALYDYCATLQTEIKSVSEKSVATIKKEGERAHVSVDDVVAQVQAKTKAKIDIMMAQVTQLVAKTMSEIESKRGPQGVPGKQGDKGKDGSSDTADEVVAKVNKAKGIKIEAIDGLEEELKKAKKAGGGGKAGGGMGNVYHETKAVSSGTTSVSTTYPIAAGGRACWLYFQGQFLVYGTHYTVNGKVITLTFDKVDGTFIDITYIR